MPVQSASTWTSQFQAPPGALRRPQAPSGICRCPYSSAHVLHTAVCRNMSPVCIQHWYISPSIGPALTSTSLTNPVPVYWRDCTWAAVFLAHRAIPPPPPPSLTSLSLSVSLSLSISTHAHSHTHRQARSLPPSPSFPFLPESLTAALAIMADMLVLHQ
jgi:hypothetical protein